MKVTLNLIQRAETLEIEAVPNQTIADLLDRIGYLKQGQEYLQAWSEHKQVTLDTSVTNGLTITITHTAMGALEGWLK